MKRVGIHDQDFIDRNAGDYTMTMTDGSLRRVQRYTSGPRAGEKDSDTVTYTLDDDRITFRWSAGSGDFTQADVDVLPDGSLKFSDWFEGMPEAKFLLLDEVVLRRWERVR